MSSKDAGIAEPRYYGFVTVHLPPVGDLRGLLFLFDNTESVMEFLIKLRETEVSFWM